MFKTIQDFQQSREVLDYSNASSKKLSQVKRKLKDGEEYDFNYGKEAVDAIMPIVEEYLNSLLEGRSGNTKKTWTRIIKPAFEAYTANPKSFKTHPFKEVAAMVAIHTVSNLSKEIDLHSLIKKMAVDCFHIFQISREEQQENNDQLMNATKTFFGDIVFTVAEKGNIIYCEMREDAYRVYPTEWWGKHIRNCFAEMDLTKEAYRPMVCEPKPHFNLTSGKGGQLFLDSPLLKRPYRKDNEVHPLIANCNVKTQPELFETINKIQATPFTINVKFLMVLDKYREKGMFFKDNAFVLDQCIDSYKAKAQEEIDEANAERKSYSDHTETEYKAISKMTANKIARKHIQGAQEEVHKTTNMIDEAWEYSYFEQFYFPFFMDHRGRRYPYASYGLTYMSNTLGKALVSFKNGKVLTEAGVSELYRSLANSLGLDKKRVDIKEQAARDWYNAYSEAFRNKDFSIFFTEQDKFDEPENALAIVLELLCYENDNEYKCGYMAHRDARCSGASIIGTMLNDKTVMSLTSVYEDEVGYDLPDAYKHGANIALEMCNVDGSKEATELLKHSEVLFSRAAFKKPVMCKCSYGLTDYSLREDNKEMIKAEGLDLSKEAIKLYNDIMIRALDKALPSCSMFLNKIREVAADILKRDGLISFTDPLTGIPVVYDEKQVKIERLTINNPFRRIKLTNKRWSDKIDKVKTKNGLAPNMIHHVDSTILIEVSKRVECDIATIHDSIASHPNDVAEVRSAYNEVMHTLNTTDYLNDILKQMTDVSIEKFKDDTVNAVHIINSKHSLA